MQYDLHAKQIQDSGILVMYINHSWVIKWKFLHQADDPKSQHVHCV